MSGLNGSGVMYNCEKLPAENRSLPLNSLCSLKNNFASMKNKLRNKCRKIMAELFHISTQVAF